MAVNTLVIWTSAIWLSSNISFYHSLKFQELMYVTQQFCTYIHTHISYSKPTTIIIVMSIDQSNILSRWCTFTFMFIKTRPFIFIKEKAIHWSQIKLMFINAQPQAALNLIRDTMEPLLHNFVAQGGHSKDEYQYINVTIAK